MQWQPDVEDGPARLGFDGQRAVVAVDDDAAGGGEPEAGAVADVLGREERVEDPLARSPAGCRARRRRCRPRRRRRRARVLIVIVPDSPSASIAFVEQVRPHLVELGAAHGQPRQRPVVVAHDLDRGVLEPVAEHDQRRLEPLVEVDVDERAAIHVGVGLDGADEIGHAPRRLLQLRGEAARRERRGHPAERGVGRGPGERRDALEPVLVDAGHGQRLGEPPGLGHAERLEPLAAARPRRRRRRARRARCARPPARCASACRATSLAASSRSMPDSTKRRSVAPTTSTASTICPAARPAAAAGLLSSCASPAAIVPSEVSRSRLCSIAVTRLMTGATCCITRRCTAGCESASRRNSAGSTTAMRQAVSACMRTPSGALGQRADGAHPGRGDVAAGRPRRDLPRSGTSASCPRAARNTPGGTSPCSARISPALGQPGRARPRATPRAARRPGRRTGRSSATRPA